MKSERNLSVSYSFWLVLLQYLYFFFFFLEYSRLVLFIFTYFPLTFHKRNETKSVLQPKIKYDYNKNPLCWYASSYWICSVPGTAQGHPDSQHPHSSFFSTESATDTKYRSNPLISPCCLDSPNRVRDLWSILCCTFLVVVNNLDIILYFYVHHLASLTSFQLIELV